MTALHREGWNLPDNHTHYHFFYLDGTPACIGSRSPKHADGPLLQQPGYADGPILQEPGTENVCTLCIFKLIRSGRLNLTVKKDEEALEPEPIWFDDAPGFTFFPSRGCTRLEVECQHQHGLIYITEGAEMNWVCSSRRRSAHSLAGFFRELGEMQDARVREVMQRWGLSFRQLPLAEQPSGEEEEATPTVIPVTPVE